MQSPVSAEKVWALFPGTQAQSSSSFIPDVRWCPADGGENRGWTGSGAHPQHSFLWPQISHLVMPDCRGDWVRSSAQWGLTWSLLFKISSFFPTLAPYSLLSLNFSPQQPFILVKNTCFYTFVLLFLPPQRECKCNEERSLVSLVPCHIIRDCARPVSLSIC